MKIIAKNKRARYDYEVKDILVAGIVLSGAEVKSVKAGHASLKGSFVTIRESEAYLTNAHINPYKFASNQASYDPTQSRKLLLHRKQIDTLLAQIKSEGMTAVPLAIGLERGLVKIEVGVGRGKKRHDKREVIKKRDMIRDANLEIKSGKRAK